MDWHNLDKTLFVSNPATTTRRTEGFFHRYVMGEYGILIPLEISCSNHGFDRNGLYHGNWKQTNSVRFLHILILSSRKVFVSVARNYQHGIPKPEMFNNTSNHDSCWRSDGLNEVSKAYNQVYEDCWGHIKDTFKIPPIMANFWAQFSDFKFVKVEHEALNKDDSYWRKLSKIEEVKYRLTLE